MSITFSLEVKRRFGEDGKCEANCRVDSADYETRAGCLDLKLVGLFQDEQFEYNLLFVVYNNSRAVSDQSRDGVACCPG